MIIDYFVKVNIAFILLYVCYLAFISKDTGLKLRRLYLISISLLAAVVPFVKISVPNTNYNFNDFDFFPETFPEPEFNTIIDITVTESYTLQEKLIILYLIISTLLILRSVFLLIKTFKKLNAYDYIKEGKYKVIINNEQNTPFSFFKFIVIDSLNYQKNGAKIIHEKAHARQFHSFDLIMTELFSAFLWVNPFIYLYRKSLIELHEYLADKEVLNNGYNSTDYKSLIVNQAAQNMHLRLISNFNNSLTKKRVKMISNKKTNTRYIKYTMLLAVTIGIFSLFAFTDNVDSINSFSSASESVKKTDNIPSICPIKKGKYKVSSGYGMKIHPIYKRKKLHTGIDLKAKQGTEVLASADGKVNFAGEKKGGYGTAVMISHGKIYTTVYAHLSKVNAKVGDIVKKGDVIGYVGNTGRSTAPHLHYEIRQRNTSSKDGKKFTYLNPEDYMDL